MPQLTETAILTSQLDRMTVYFCERIAWAEEASEGHPDGSYMHGWHRGLAAGYRIMLDDLVERRNFARTLASAAEGASNA